MVQITKFMKKFLFFTLTLLSFNAICQTITIEKTDYPYFDIFEWKGMGGILMSKDPSGNNKQINLTLVGSQPKSIWDQKFTPRNKEYYFISSENARYVYFLHNLTPEEGKIYFAQLNSAGNVKATSVSLATALKKIGDFSLDELELRNVVVTDKALVHQFRYHDKKEKSFREIAVFTTHHNLLVYAVELGSVTEEALKNGKANHWRYVGFEGDKICFAVSEYQNKSNGWTVKLFNSKGELQEGTYLNAPTSKFSSVQNIGFGTTGAYHLNTDSDAQNALLTFHNNRYYLTGIVTDKGETELQLLEWKEKEWVKINQSTIDKTISKKGYQLGVYPLNEGLGYHLISATGDITTVLKFDNSATIINPFTPKTVYNPSRIIIDENKKLFAVTLPEGNLFFNLEELNKEGSVEFEFMAK